MTVSSEEKKRSRERAENGMLCIVQARYTRVKKMMRINPE